MYLCVYDCVRMNPNRTQVHPLTTQVTDVLMFRILLKISRSDNKEIVQLFWNVPVLYTAGHTALLFCHHSGLLCFQIFYTWFKIFVISCYPFSLLIVAYTYVSDFAIHLFSNLYNFLHKFYTNYVTLLLPINYTPNFILIFFHYKN